jgi:hypothetical protein
MVVIGKARGLSPLFPSNEDERWGTSGGLEKGLEGVQFVPFHLETVSLGLFPHLDQPIRLLSFSVDAASVHEEKDP